MADPRIKQIKIKTGVVKRLAKEKAMYEREAEKEKSKLTSMQASDSDSYMIRKQEEVVKESVMMIPDTVKRFKVAYSELKDILESELELSENEDYLAAQQVLKDTSQLLETVQ